MLSSLVEQFVVRYNKKQKKKLVGRLLSKDVQLKLKKSSKSSITVSALKNLEEGADIFACDLSKNSTTDVQNSIKSIQLEYFKNERH